MKTQILALSAAALMLAATAAAATPAESEQYANRLLPKAESLLSAAGIGPQTQPVSVRATVSPGRYGRSLHIAS